MIGAWLELIIMGCIAGLLLCLGWLLVSFMRWLPKWAAVAMVSAPMLVLYFG